MVSHAVPFWWRIVVSEETAVVQVTEVLLVAPVVHVILRSVQHSVLRWTKSRPWLPQVIANGNRRLKGMGVPPTDAAALRPWADFWAVALSHRSSRGHRWLGAASFGPSHPGPPQRHPRVCVGTR